MISLLNPSAWEMTIRGPAHSWQRPRFGRTMNGQGIVYSSSKNTSWKNTIGSYALAAMNRANVRCFAGPIHLTIDIALEIPSTWPKWKRELALAGMVVPTSKPDYDNVIKGIMDGLNGVAWLDDAQVVAAIVAKHYAPEAWTKVRVVQMNVYPAQISERPPEVA